MLLMMSILKCKVELIELADTVYPPRQYYKDYKKYNYNIYISKLVISHAKQPDMTDNLSFASYYEKSLNELHCRLLLNETSLSEEDAKSQ